MRLPRFTTRRLMVLVATVGMAIFTAQTLQRWRKCQKQAGVYASDARRFRSALSSMEPRLAMLRRRAAKDALSAKQTVWLAANVEWLQRRIPYVEEMRRKYEQAMRRPWLPVPPDPQPPE